MALLGLNLSRPLAASGCDVGKRVQLASQCANLWPGPSQPEVLEWKARRENEALLRVDPFASMGNPTTCDSSEVIIREIKPKFDLARVTCGSDQGSSEGWINLDFLSCSPTRIQHSAARPKIDPLNCSECINNLLQLEVREYEARAANVQAATQEFHRAFVQRARKRSDEVAAKAKEDHAKISSFYSRLSPEQMVARIRRAAREIQEEAKLLSSRFGSDCKSSPKRFVAADLVRAQSVCELVLASKEQAELLSKRIDGLATGFELIPRQGGDETRAAIKKIVDQATSRPEASRFEMLAVHQALLRGMKPEEIDSLSLNFIGPAFELGGKFAEKRFLNLGYRFGGGLTGANSGNGEDCGTFVAGMWGGSGVNTRTLRDISLYLLNKKRGRSSRAPKAEWRGYHHCFEAVDLRAGEPLIPSDLLISMNFKEEGHVGIAVDVDQLAFNGTVTLAEAKSFKEGIGDFARPIYEPEPGCLASDRSRNWESRPIRPGLYALRFKAENTAGCPFDPETLK